MLEAFAPDAIQPPASIVAPDLVLNGLVAKKAAYHSPLGLPTGVDFHLIGGGPGPAIVIECVSSPWWGGGQGPAIVIECGRSPKQPTSVAWLQQRGVAARSVEPHPCRELAQPRAPVTG